MSTRVELLEHWPIAKAAFRADPSLTSAQAGPMTFHRQIGLYDGRPATRVFCNGSIVELVVDGKTHYSIESDDSPLLN